LLNPPVAVLEDEQFLNDVEHQGLSLRATVSAAAVQRQPRVRTAFGSIALRPFQRRNLWHSSDL
jgi:hypothetical protein